MKTRIPALIASLAFGCSLALSSVATATAAAPILAGGPAGRGVCATQFAALKPPVTVDALRAFGDCEIARRFTPLDALQTKVSGSKVLTTSDSAALSAEVGATKTGLTELKATIDAETAIPALKADVVAIATKFRVYLLVAPQVHLVTAADGVMASQAAFTRVDANLSGRIAAAKAAGKDMMAAQSDLDAMNAAVAQAIGLATPLSATLLPLTPAGYNSGTAEPILNSARTALLQARDLLKSAVQDARACRVALA